MQSNLVFHYKLIFALIIIPIFSFILIQFFDEKNDVELFLDKSVPYVGANYPLESGIDGEGIKIAIIDTGVDFNHPDLFGFGLDGKVVGGYDYVDNDDIPMDTNGHGTEVAGVIAADGNLKGIAPKSKILAYRVSDDGESVSSDLIIQAINQAIKDDADIINISLGVNKTNKKIDDIVNKAIKENIVVVTAAGNNGPMPGTIGSPGINHNAITVGASYNNITSSLVATFEVENLQFQVLPMVGTTVPSDLLTGKIVFGGHGREKDLNDIDIQDSILLVERGSDNEEEIVYFSDKENNAANKGAKALLVYNNQPGIFLGELIHEFIEEDYKPRLPTLSMSNEDGMQIRSLILENKNNAELNLFYNPDYVVHFSSRGPVSPFYTKPDLVAPGVFVNTTLIDGKYNLTSGTSFATPHVSGTAALLLQKNPELTPNEVKSLLVTTTDFVSDAYGTKFPLDIAGSGRLNVTKAFDARMIIEPAFLLFNLSPNNSHAEQTLEIKDYSWKHQEPEIEISFDENENVSLSYELDGNSLTVTAALLQKTFESIEQIMTIKYDDATYRVPIVIRITESTVTLNENDGKIDFKIEHQQDWIYAKISAVNNQNGQMYVTSATPEKNATISVAEPGEYWIEAKINSNQETFDAYTIVNVDSVNNQRNFGLPYLLDIPEKQIAVIGIIVLIIILVGIKIRKTTEPNLV